MTEGGKKINSKGKLDFIVPIQLKNTTEEWKGGKKRIKKKSKRTCRTRQNVKIIDVFHVSLLSESFPSLGVTVHLTSLGGPPTLG